MGTVTFVPNIVYDHPSTTVDYWNRIDKGNDLLLRYGRIEHQAACLVLWLTCFWVSYC